jgi:hypothetical protein
MRVIDARNTRPRQPPDSRLRYSSRAGPATPPFLIFSVAMVALRLTKTSLSLLLMAAGLVWADTPRPPPAAADAGKQLPQIDVHARKTLQRSLDSYLYKVTHTSVAIDDVPMVQWSGPICPLVTGLPHDLGQGLFDDFTQVLDSLDRPRGQQGCKPNFIIIAMSHPQERLREWRHRHSVAFSYYEGGTDKFLNTTDAVRVWYNKLDVDFDGAGARDTGEMLLDRVFTGVPGFRGPSNGNSPRFTYTAIPTLQNVIVVVDLEKIVGYAIAPLAEYIAMAGLTQVDLDASYGETPTILRLFSVADKDRPEGLSTWDRSFIKAVYATDQRSRMQRVAVVQHMLADLSH